MDRKQYQVPQVIEYGNVSEIVRLTPIISLIP